MQVSEVATIAPPYLPTARLKNQRRIGSGGSQKPSTYRTCHSVAAHEGRQLFLQASRVESSRHGHRLEVFAHGGWHHRGFLNAPTTTAFGPTHKAEDSDHAA